MRRTRLRNRTHIKTHRNADGKPRERFEGLRLDDFRVWIGNRKCLLDGSGNCVYRDHKSDPAHVESKARGAGDAGNIVPLCRRHHNEQHDYGIKSFQREHGINLRDVAGALWLAFESEKGVAKL